MLLHSKKIYVPVGNTCTSTYCAGGVNVFTITFFRDIVYTMLLKVQ